MTNIGKSGIKSHQCAVRRARFRNTREIHGAVEQTRKGLRSRNSFPGAETKEQPTERITSQFARRA